MIVIVDNTTRTKWFLPKLLSYLDARNVKYICVRSLDEIPTLHDVQGFILSGSSAQVPEISSKQWQLNALPLTRQVPVLGICFGAQFLNVCLGGTLKALRRTYCRNFKVHSDGESFSAKFCNRYVFDALGEELEPILEYTVEGEERVCAFRHKKRDVFGVLFHPEDSDRTYPILDAFVDRTRERLRSS